MNFSWIKNDKICIETLIKKWNDNFSIFEQIEKDIVSNDYVRFRPIYSLSVYRNKTFYDFHLDKHQANYLIYKLDMVTMLNFINHDWGYQRRFFQKSAYGKVCFGYKFLNVEKFEWEKAYG